jgi:enamine deaminase RidA (YjgF/YER057c/UK114 family)
VKTDHLIFLPGMTSREPGSGTAQTRDIFEQMESSLEDEHSDLEHLAKATYYVSDEESSSALNKLRPDYYNPKRPPAASKVMVDGVGRAERSLSIDMIAIPAEPPAKPSESE